MVIYSKEEKTLIIPEGLGYDAEQQYEKGYESGYNEGIEDGKSIQDRKLTDSVTFNENGEYDADYGYKKVIVDVYNQWDKGYRWGYADGYTSGYTNGYAEGQASCPGCNEKKVVLKVIKWEIIFGNITYTTLSINGVPVDDCGDTGWFQGNPSFLEISGITEESAVTNVQFSYRVIGGIPQTWDTTAYINGVETEILSQNCVVDGEIYTYTMTFGNVPIVDKEAYAQGYTDGQASCPECSGSTDCSSAITEAFESGYTAGYSSGYSAGQADCEGGCDDYLECSTPVFFAEDTVIPAPSSVGVSNYIFYNLDMAYTFVYGAKGWEHNGESLYYIVFNEVTLPAGQYEFKSILKQNGEWYTSGSGSLVMVTNDIIPGGVISSRYYSNENLFPPLK